MKPPAIAKAKVGDVIKINFDKDGANVNCYAIITYIDTIIFRINDGENYFEFNYDDQFIDLKFIRSNQILLRLYPSQENKLFIYDENNNLLHRKPVIVPNPYVRKKSPGKKQHGRNEQ